MDKVRIKAKASSVPATAALATALQLLQSASSVPGCPPVISPVCAVALQIIQMAQTAQQNRETCNELVERISQIMIVVLKPYVEQQAPNMTTGMQENIERLTRDLVDISTKLREVLGKNIIKAWTLSSLYKQQIAGYSTTLDWAMNVFKVDTLLRLEIKLDALTLQQSSSSALPAAGISDQFLGLPPRPEVFFGREEVVEDIVGRLVSTLNGRFSIGGPGGLGKTSVALTAVHDFRVVAKFRDGRYWVPCDQATAASSLIRLLAQSLKISISSASLLERVVVQLSRDDAPKLVLLDNFETPWDAEDQRPDIETILKHLVSVPSVTLLITVRSERPPSNAIKWTFPVLKPLETLTLDAARQVYTQWHPDTANDPTLNTLLHELSYMPLAVTLMASRGAFGETPKELLTRWRSIGTATLGRSGTRLDSVQVSIRLSLDSRTMKSNPHALELLSLLTLLPAGAPRDLLADMAPDIDAYEALLVLQKGSLAHIDSKSGYVSLLSPVQQFVAEFHPPTKKQLGTVFEVFRALLLAAKGMTDLENSWRPVRQAVITHFPNVEAILLKRLEASGPDDAIDLAIQICEWNESPSNLRLIIAASNTARRIADPFLNARCNYALGILTRWTDRLEAVGIWKDSLAAFQDIQDQQRTLQCLSLIAEALYVANAYEEATSYAEKAADLARSLDDDGKYADSIKVLARISIDQGRLDDALVKMEQVHQIQQRAKQTKGNLSVIGTFLIYAGLLRRCMRFEEAHAKLEGALTLMRDLADPTYYEAWQQQELGDLYRDQDRIDSALEVYTVSAAKYLEGGFIEAALWRHVNVGDMLFRKHRKHGVSFGSRRSPEYNKNLRPYSGS